MTVIGPHPDRSGLLINRSDICCKNPVALPG